MPSIQEELMKDPFHKLFGSIQKNYLWDRTIFITLPTESNCVSKIRMEEVLPMCYGSFTYTETSPKDGALSQKWVQ